jgi:hypothetical protein
MHFLMIASLVLNVVLAIGLIVAIRFLFKMWP